MKTGLETFSLKERSNFAFNLILLYLTMMLTLFGFFTMTKEGMGGEAALAVIASIVTVILIYHLTKKREKQEIIQKNKDLQNENRALRLKNEQLLAQKNKLETNENENFKSLENEKLVIKSSIEDLLKSINSLEDTSTQITK